MTTNNQARLYKDIMNKLEFEPGLDVSNISISVKDNGAIILAGEVSSYMAKVQAGKVVQKVKGVKGIANELQVNLAAPYFRSDIEILNAILDIIKWNILVPEDAIGVSVEDGCVILSGKVEKYYQKRQTEKSIQNLMGVKEVVNNIVLEPLVSSENILEEIIKEFARNGHVSDGIKVDVKESTVILTGLVKNFNEKQEANLIAWSVPGVENVIDNLWINWEVDEE